MSTHPGDVTRLLNAWCQGDQGALEALAPVIEQELRRIARAYMQREHPGHTLQPTALINEAYLQLFAWNPVSWQDRAHFLAVAAKMMRRILVNHAVSRQRQKRSGGAVHVSLSDALGEAEKSHDLIALDDALSDLARIDARKARLVELRYFGGLTAEEATAVLGISVRTVHREWDLAGPTPAHRGARRMPASSSTAPHRRRPSDSAGARSQPRPPAARPRPSRRPPCLRWWSGPWTYDCRNSP